MWPVPWFVFTRLLKRGSGKTKAVLGGLTDDQRRVHHFVVKHLPRYVNPMPPEVIAESLKMDPAAVVEILDELERRLIFLFRPRGHDVVWAYPVTAEPTPHRLSFSSGERLWAA
jgi:hypothetical protein